MKYMVFDTETTGLDRIRSSINKPCSVSDNGDEIIQIGGLVFNERLEVSRAFCHFCDVLLPESKKDAARTHGIKMQEVRKYIPGVFFEEVAIRFIPELFDPNIVFVGYNVDFDMRMVLQSIRNLGSPVGACTPVIGRLPRSGRHTLDVLKYLPAKVKLVSFYRELIPDRCAFHERYAGTLPLETNIPDLFIQSWEHNHNALFDSIETFLVLQEKVWGKKIIV